MGKFIDEKAIINNNIKNYNDFVNDKGRYLEGSQTYVTWYAKDVNASTQDVGLGAVVELVGNDSPIKYDRIENVPLFNFNESQLDYDYDEETGLDVNIEGDATIPPDIFKPLPDDFFVVSYLNRRLLFRVSNVKGSSIGDKFFYGVDYYLSEYNIDLLDNQVVKRYTVIFDNIGNRKKSLIEEKDYTLIEKIDEVYMNIREQYVKLFYNKEMNLFLMEYEKDSYFYDNYMHEFINRHNLFIKEKTFLMNLKIEPALYVNRSLYKNTLYYYIETFKTLERENLMKISNSVYFIPLAKNHNDYKNKFNRTYKTILASNWLNLNNTEEISVENKFLKTIVLEDYDNSKYNEFEKVFIEYYREVSFLDDKIIKVLKILQDYEVKEDLSSYINIPCILYILKELTNKILN